MAGKNNANIGFEKQIWDAACVLWGHIPAAEYRKVIVGLIFLRYISSAFEKRYEVLLKEGDGFENDRDAYAEENIFFVPEEARWSKISSAAHTPEIGTVIDDAMRAIEKENTSLKNVLPKNYASPDLDKRVLGEVVDLFTNEVKMDGTEASKDLLGRTYEYCIAQFAAYEGTKGGEFYTPSSIVKTIVAILKPFNNCRVYDPCCGSGTTLVIAQELGINSVGIDINPYATLLSFVKTNKYDKADVYNAISTIKSNLEQELNFPIYDFYNIKKWFRDDIIKSLSQIRHCILLEKSQDIRKFFGFVYLKLYLNLAMIGLARLNYTLFQRKK